MGDIERSERAVWRRSGDDFVEVSSLRNPSRRGAFVVTDRAPPVNTVIELELLDGDGDRTFAGRARVALVKGEAGMVVELLGSAPARSTAASPAMKKTVVERPMPKRVSGAAPLVKKSVRRREARASKQRPRGAPEPVLTRAVDTAPPAGTVEARDDAGVVIEPAGGTDRVQLDTTEHGITIGIDLGTTNTCVSWMSEGKPRIIPTRAGANTTPSVVNVEESGAIVVGHRAAARVILEPLRTVYGSKRLLGRTFQKEVADEYQAHFAYPIVEVDDQRYGAGLEGRALSMREVATLVLKEVLATAREHLGEPVDTAVITVPAYFSDVQRSAVRAAARDAGIYVRRIVNEPTAAAIAWSRENARESEAETCVVVWDLGGGTFDVSVLAVRGERYEVLATGGDCFLGGIDFDDIIASRLLERFERSEGVKLDPTPQQLARLRRAAEEAKRALSAQESYGVFLPELVTNPRRHLRTTLTRAEVDGLTAPLVERMVELAREVLTSIELEPAAVDDVVAVGGMSRMPCVERAVTELFGKQPSRRVSPDEAVAIGAAVLAASDDGPGHPELRDVLPISLGFAGPERRFRRVVARNTPVPIDRGLVVPVTDDAATFSMPLFQGEDPDATRNEYVCTVVVEELPDGEDRRIEVLVSLDEQCRLEVRASCAATGRDLGMRLDRDRPVEDVLAELGAYDGPPSSSWRHPQTTVGGLFRRMRDLFSS
jgi:molecular chaperone DnaK (HSP70)